MTNKNLTSNKWFVLAMATFTLAGAVGIPFTAMPVLFGSVKQELHLTLAQIGLIWGAMPLGVAVFSYPGGLLGDRYGFRRVSGIGCLLIAATSGLRGLSSGAPMLVVTMFLCGMAAGLVVPNIPKAASLFFPRRQLGMAIGIINSGFNAGSIFATALGAAVILPLLGSWRDVLYFYAVIGACLGVLWLIVFRETGQRPEGEVPLTAEKRVPFRESMSVTLKTRDIWLLVVAGIGVIGSFLSVVGYMPLYLQQAGVPTNMGDTISSTIFVAGIAGTLLVPAISDRLGTRKKILIVGSLIMGAAILLLSVASTGFLWVLMPVIGLVGMGVGTLCITIPFEIQEIGPVYGASAIGIIIASQNFGGFLLPMAGNGVAENQPSYAFLLWGALIFLAVICFFLIRDTGHRYQEAEPPLMTEPGPARDA